MSIILSGIFMASIGEVLCARSELEDIPLYVRDESHERLIPTKNPARPHSPNMGSSSGLELLQRGRDGAQGSQHNLQHS